MESWGSRVHFGALRWELCEWNRVSRPAMLAVMGSPQRGPNSGVSGGHAGTPAALTSAPTRGHQRTTLEAPQWGLRSQVPCPKQPKVSLPPYWCSTCTHVRNVTQPNAQALPPQNKGEDEGVKEVVTQR